VVFFPSGFLAKLLCVSQMEVTKGEFYSHNIFSVRYYICKLFCEVGGFRLIDSYRSFSDVAVDAAILKQQRSQAESGLSAQYKSTYKRFPGCHVPLQDQYPL
jgi:hypothetical protein